MATDLPGGDILGDGDPIEAVAALIEAGRAHDAARALRARLAEGRGGALARIALVEALIQSGDVRGALAEAREAASLYPNLSPVMVTLGEALLAAEALPAAIAEFQRALRLDPDDGKARALIAQAWLKAGEADKALEILEPLEDSPERTAMVAQAHRIKAAHRSDPGYVRHLFDQFSADYDTRMIGHLHYAAPQILRGLFDLVMAGRADLRVFDLGCGTGLSGAAFRDVAAWLEGVDLSPAMIEKAGARRIYDALGVGDLETALQSGPSFDLILAADTLVYLGDLAPVFHAAGARLAPEGCFLFTVEQAVGTDFELGPKRRWRHSEDYLRRIAAAAGLAVAGLVAATPRQEAHQPVEGFAVALMRGA